MMKQFEQMDQMLTMQDGMLRTSQVIAAGISKPMFYDYVRSRDLERAAHGIYISKDSWVDSMYLLHLRFEQAVFGGAFMIKTAKQLKDLIRNLSREKSADVM